MEESTQLEAGTGSDERLTTCPACTGVLANGQHADAPCTFAFGDLVHVDLQPDKRFCIFCEVKPGEPCRGAAMFGSKPLPYYHAARRRRSS